MFPSFRFVSLFSTLGVLSVLAAGTAQAFPPRVLEARKIATALAAHPLWYPSYYGQSVVSLGDLDGNGRSDLAVGVPADDDGGPDRGAVSILLLAVNGDVASTVKIGAASGPLAAALSDEDGFGTSLAAIGDVDGDGVPDLAVGTIGDDDGAENAGAVWIVTLAADGTAKAFHKLSALTAGLAGAPAEFDAFGSAIAAVGDLDGNGHADLAIGAKGSDLVRFNGGAVWIIRMGAGLSVIGVQRLGDDDSGFDDAVAARSALGGFLTMREGELFATAAGDGTGFQPAALTHALRLNSAGEVVAHRLQDTSGEAFQGIVEYSDFDFDGTTDLLLARSNGFDLLLYEDGGAVGGVEEYRGYPSELPWGFSVTVVDTIDDVDDNGLRDVAVHLPEDGALWLVRLNGRSPEGASCGDPTGDGNVTVADALHVLRTAVRLAFCELLWCDVNLSGAITATDALAVLQRSVNSEDLLACPTTTTTTSTSSSVVIDECFEDSDCSHEEVERYCCAYTCCECDGDEHCADGFVCEGDVCVVGVR
ncbi:MAG: integrin alpha [Candidatus Binatia bacterium]